MDEPLKLAESIEVDSIEFAGAVRLCDSGELADVLELADSAK